MVATYVAKFHVLLIACASLYICLMINLIALVKERKTSKVIIRARYLWNVQKYVVGESVFINVGTISSTSGYQGNTLLQPCEKFETNREGGRIIYLNNIILVDAQLYVKTKNQWYQLAKNKGYLRLKTLQNLPQKSIQC
jgi:hypothetical protein